MSNSTQFLDLPASTPPPFPSFKTWAPKSDIAFPTFETWVPESDMRFHSSIREHAFGPKHTPLASSNMHVSSSSQGITQSLHPFPSIKPVVHATRPVNIGFGLIAGSTFAVAVVISILVGAVIGRRLGTFTYNTWLRGGERKGTDEEVGEKRMLITL